MAIIILKKYKMISFLLGNIKNIGLVIVAFFTIYILKRNKTLSTENIKLTEDNSQKDKVINIQNEVLDATEKIDPADLDTNLERLSDKNR